MHDDERRRRKRDKAQRRARFEAARRHDHPAGGPMPIYMGGAAAAGLPVFRAGGRQIRLDLSPGVVAGVPADQIHHLVGCVLVPRLLARLRESPAHRRRLVKCGAVETESELSPDQGPDHAHAHQAGPPCVASLWWCPACPDAGLIACTLDELRETVPLWRPDLRGFLKAAADHLQHSDGVLKGLYQEAHAAGQEMAIDLAGVSTVVDLSPGVLARVPGRPFDHLVHSVVAPKLRARRKAYRHGPYPDGNPNRPYATLWLERPAPGSDVPLYLVSALYYPGHDDARLVSCLVDELDDASLWTPGQRAELKGHVARLLARPDNGGAGLDGADLD
jgi:hypothetical protein